jgi:uncharacterized protein (DUF58 family)
MKLFLAAGSVLLILFFPFWFVQFTAVLVLLVIVLSFMYSRLIYNSIRVTRSQHIIRAYRLQIIEVEFLLTNRSLFPIHYVYVFENPGEFSPVTRGTFLVSMSKRQTVRLTYRVKGLSRGEYHLGPIIIKSGDPLGLFPWEKKIEDTCRVIIYPAMWRVTHTITKGYPGGNIKINDRMFEDVTRLKSIREYIPGDDIRHISWKLSARLGTLHTREYLSSLHSPVMLVLNLTLDDYPLKHRYAHVEKAIETAASLTAFYTSLKQEVGLISSGIIDGVHPHIDIRGGHEHAMLLLENLAVIRGCAGQADSIGLLNDSRLPLPNGVRIILIGPALTAAQAEAFAVFRRRRSFLECIRIGGGKKAEHHPRIRDYTLPDIGGESRFV